MSGRRRAGGAKAPDEKPVLEFRNGAAFDRWLKANHARSTGIWLRMAKKGSGIPSVTYDQALEVALCYGWIDGQVKRDNETHWRQKFTPRGKRSIWSKRNRGIVRALIKDGRMQPAGLQEVQRARKDGRWAAAYDSPGTMQMPADFAAALKSQPAAHSFYQTLNRQNQFALHFRITTAKRSETRARRIEQFIEMLLRKEKFHP